MGMAVGVNNSQTNCPYALNKKNNLSIKYYSKRGNLNTFTPVALGHYKVEI